MSEWAGQNCLFVAKMTNEQLAVALINTFRHFGPVLAVKASRDARGRPFGFVEFAESHSAKAALAAAALIHICFRPVRIEPAKCQRRISVKKHVPADADLAIEVAKLRAALLQHAGQEEVKLNVFESEQGRAVTALLKFNESPAAERTFAAVSQLEAVTVAWLNAEQPAQGSGIRQSGLVHIVPGKIGLPYLNYADPYLHPYELLYTPSPVPKAPVAPPVFEEELVPRGSPLSIDVARDFEDVSLGGEKGIPERVLEATLFAGRLNSQKVTKDLLIEHFSRYGPIRYVCLFNRGVKSAAGIPLDSYAFVSFADKAAAKVAISTEHGAVWLGQTMRCEQARVLPPTPTVVQLYH